MTRGDEDTGLYCFGTKKKKERLRAKNIPGSEKKAQGNMLIEK